MSMQEQGSGQTICLTQDLTTSGATMTALRHTEVMEEIPIPVMSPTGVRGLLVAKHVTAGHNQNQENSAIILEHKLETVKIAFLRRGLAGTFQNVRSNPTLETMIPFSAKMSFQNLHPRGIPKVLSQKV